MLIRIFIIALTSFLLVLFTCLTYAECTKTICVTEPEAGDIFTSGRVSYINVEINNPGIHLSKLKLYYSLVKPPKWKLITIRECSMFYCPTEYPWEVAWVPTVVTTAKIKAVLLDTNGQVVARDKSDLFQINPYNLGPLSVAPSSVSICENNKSCSAGKDIVKFYILGNGLPPYTVISSHPHIIPSLSNVYYQFKVNANNDSITADKNVILYVKDSSNPQQIVTVKLKVINQ